MNIYIYERGKEQITIECEVVLLNNGCAVVNDINDCDMAIAPLLNKIIKQKEIEKPMIGTLIFHPSLLPVHRGRDAIKWSYRHNEKYSGATWFWVNEGIDSGDICEQEVLLINGSPREYYESVIIPSAVRMLGLIVKDMKNGYVRRRKQNEQHATYEPPIIKQQTT